VRQENGGASGNSAGDETDGELKERLMAKILPSPTLDHDEPAASPQEGTSAVSVETCISDPPVRRRKVIRVAVAVAGVLGIFGVFSLGGDVRSAAAWTLWMLLLAGFFGGLAVKDSPIVAPRLRVVARILFWVTGALILGSIVWRVTRHHQEMDAVDWAGALAWSTLMIGDALKVPGRTLNWVLFGIFQGLILWGVVQKLGQMSLGCWIVTLVVEMMLLKSALQMLRRPHHSSSSCVTAASLSGRARLPARRHRSGDDQSECESAGP
jgi:hypothetical protein